MEHEVCVDERYLNLLQDIAFVWMTTVPTDEQLDAPVPALAGRSGRELLIALRKEFAPKWLYGFGDRIKREEDED